MWNPTFFHGVPRLSGDQVGLAGPAFLTSYWAKNQRKKTCFFDQRYCTYIYIYVYTHDVHIYVYIYICILYVYIDISIHILKKFTYLSIYIYIYMYCSKAHIVYLFLYFIQDLAITIRDPQVIRIRLHTWTCHGGTVSGISSMYSTCLNSVK